MRKRKIALASSLISVVGVLLLLVSCDGILVGNPLVSDEDASLMEIGVNEDETLPYAETGELAGMGKRDMVRVESGTFSHSGTFDHSISYDYLIGKYEVTYELWYTVRVWGEENGYIFLNLASEGDDGSYGAEPTEEAKHEPVSDVSWYDAVVWCNAYSEMEGLQPCYTYSGYVIRDTGDTVALDSAVCDWSTDGYRLPSEGEWEFAASGRGALTSDAPSGSNLAALDQLAWYDLNSGDVTHPVGTRLPNELRIFDMSGNVYEWCWDWYGTLPTAAQTDYYGAAGGTYDYHMRKGGDFSNASTFLGIQQRLYDYPDTAYANFGLRVARTAPD